MSAAEPTRTRCCVVGGGPAGMMTGFLLARAGIEVVVIEKHLDFFRDFRGDTIHPSTLELMHELGLLEEFLRLPHQEVAELRANVDGTEVAVADLSRLPTRCRFIAFMPQWDFLNFLAARAQRYPSFRLEMGTEAVDLVRAGGPVTGVRVRTAGGEREILADLVIAADGRSSILRERAGLPLREYDAPIDVLWMRLNKGAAASTHTLGYIAAGHFLIVLDRGDYFQCGYVIRKGGLAALQAAGLPAFRTQLAELAPFLREAAGGLADWKDVKLLTVQINRALRWHLPGFLCIGDSAHAMSPAGGVGINLAVQDAVAAANLLAAPLARGPVPESLLRRVQRRRELPVRVIQALQVAAHRRMFKPRPGSRKAGLPLPARLVFGLPLFRRLTGRLIGMGIRPEHVGR